MGLIGLIEVKSGLENIIYTLESLTLIDRP